MTQVRQPRFRRANMAEWLLLLIAFLMLGATLTSWYSVEKSRLITAENERLAALSKILVKEVAINLTAVNNAVGGVIRDRVNGKKAIDPVQVGWRLRALVEAMPGVRGIVVLDAQANVIAAMPQDLLGRNFSQRAYFTVPKQVGDTGMLYMTPPFRSIRGETVMSVTRIIPGPDGFHGVVTAVLDPHYFSDMLHTALYAADLRTTIVHSSGGIFVDIGARPNGVGKEQLDTGAVLVPVRLRTDSTLGLTLHRDLAMVQAPLQRQARAFAGICAVLALTCAGVLAWSQSRRRRHRSVVTRQAQERIRAEALSASEARFRTLIEEAPVAVAMSRHGRFIYTNRRYNILHGYAAGEDLTGLRWSAMISPDSLRGLQAQQASLDTDASIEQRFEAIGAGNDDKLIPLMKATTRVMLGDGPATLIFVQDISAQKTAELNLLDARDAAQAANRSKAVFLANMSHEIRTPLNAILGMAYLLERGNRDADTSSMLQKIRVAGRSLLGIINDILDVSKIEAGALIIEHSWFQLQDVIDTVAATMGVAVGDKPIELRIAPLPPMAACVLGDALRLEQLLVNLTSNAIKFTESGSVALTITAHGMPDGRTMLRFQVTDTGIGIAADQQDNVFSPFTQADSSTTRKYGGSGLGLTICKQIIALMNGQIGMHSVPGCGSTFWFSVTLAVRPLPGTSSSPEMLNLEVIVAAPGDATLNTLADTARALGWHVRSADTGEAILAEFRRERHGLRPGVAFLEWRPGCTAWLATAQAIRADPTADGCAIVMVITAYQAVAFGLDPSHALADSLLIMPVTASTLYNAVMEARRKRQEGSGVIALRVTGRRVLDGVRILVVDDSGINRDVAGRILAEEGARVALAENGRTAIDWLLANAGAVDLVLMDVQMPVMDGIEATRILRGMPQFAALPIVALTAGAFSSHQEAARAAGMDHFIVKPFDVPLTVELIRRLTSSAAAPRSGIATPPDLDDQPGVLDLKRGLKTWGTRANYQRYLRKFAAAYGDVVVTMRRDLANGKPAAVAAAAHKLAGAAANVALPHVVDLARRIDDVPADPDTLAALLGELHLAIGTALDAIVQFAPPMTDAVASTAPLETVATTLPLFDNMIAALEEGMPEPALAALREMARHFPSALLAPIAASIDDFDWAGAMRHTATMATHYQPESPSSSCH